MITSIGAKKGINLEDSQIVKEFRKKFRKNMEEREDNLLGEISLTEEPISVVVFGEAHNWADNIKRWNENHNKKYNLITVTPETYADTKRWLLDHQRIPSIESD